MEFVPIFDCDRLAPMNGISSPTTHHSSHLHYVMYC